MNKAHSKNKVSKAVGARGWAGGTVIWQGRDLPPNLMPVLDSYLKMPNGRARYVWGYGLTQDQFDAMLEGRSENGPLNRDWAAVRLIEWAPYAEMIRRIGYKALVENWPRWWSRLRSEQQKRSLYFVVAWLSQHHPELLG